jgi:hypothetical protein
LGYQLPALKLFKHSSDVRSGITIGVRDKMKLFLKYLKWYAKIVKWWIIIPCCAIIIYFFPYFYVGLVVVILLVVWFIGWQLNKREENDKAKSPPAIPK